MALNYTCRACSKALSRQSSPIFQSSHTSRKDLFRKAPQQHPSLSASAPSFYHATSTLSANVKTEPSPAKKSSPRSQSTTSGLVQRLREKAPLMTETYVAYGATQELMKACSASGDYKIPQALEKGGEIPTDDNGVHIGEGSGWWYETLGLQPNFSNWTQITFIHMYMLQVRFRMFPKSHAPVWIQHLTNHAFYHAEDRLAVWHKFYSASIRQKYLKDMFSQWRAVLLSYDEGLMKGDAVLAAAIWRNLLGAKEDVDFQKVAQIVGYMRRELQRLEKATDDEVAGGQWTFRGDPGQEAGLVKSPSRMMTMEGTKA